MNNENIKNVNETEKDRSYNPVRNNSGCYDFTAHKAIENAEYKSYEEMRYKTFMKTIFSICKLSGFYIESRLEVTDLKTGKTWR